MAQRPTINLIDNPVAVGEAHPPAEPTVERRPSLEQRPPARRRQASADQERPPRTPPAAAPVPAPASRVDAATNPYAGMRKVQAPVRLFPPLWDHLEGLVRELQGEGLEVDKTALLNAVLHFHGPHDVAAGRELANRWRALLARPPAPRR